MKALYARLVARFDVLAQRERLLVAVALLGGVLMIGWALFIDPERGRTTVAERTVAGQQLQLKALQEQMAAMQAPGLGPEVQAQGELAVLKKQLAEIGVRLSAMENALVPPQRMSNLLESMIGGRSGLRLLSLRTLPVSPLLERKDGAKESGPASGQSGPAGGLFRHGVELRLEGSYAELTEYLARLEKSPQKLLWSSVSLSADKHPKLVMTLTVSTLSLDRAWLVF